MFVQTEIDWRFVLRFVVFEINKWPSRGGESCAAGRDMRRRRETCDDAERHATTPRDMRRRETCNTKRDVTPTVLQRRLQRDSMKHRSIRKRLLHEQKEQSVHRRVEDDSGGVSYRCVRPSCKDQSSRTSHAEH